MCLNQTRLTMRLLLLLIFCLLCCTALYSQSCTDSSYKLRFSAPDSIYTTHHITTADGGTLVLAEVFAWPVKKVLLFRLDKKSRLLWSRILTEPSGQLQPARVLELTDGTIVLAGISRPLRAGPEKVFLARLDAAGLLQWQQLYAPAHNNLNPIHLHALAEGVGGDLLLAWKREQINDAVGENACSLTALRVSSTGAPAWSKTFRIGYPGVVNASGIFLRGGKVLVTGQVNDNRLPCPANGSRGAFFLMQLDYNSGIIEKHRNYCYREVPSNLGQVEDGEAHFSAELLHDGRLALFGASFLRTDSTYLYHVVFDEALQPVDARLYAVPYTEANNANHIRVLPTGRIHIAVVNSKAGEAWRATVAADGTITRQRRQPFSSAILAKDYIYYHNYPYLTFRWAPAGGDAFTLTNNSGAHGRQAIEFSYLSGDDDTLACLGTDYRFVTARPYSVEEVTWSWQAVEDNPIRSLPLALLPAAYPLQSEAVCGEVSTCSTVTVQGASTFCAGEALYTARRNDGCTRRVVWSTSPGTTGVTLAPQSDSTVLLRFTGAVTAPVTVSLVAALAGCPSVGDTVALTVLPALQPLPADTVLCEGATLDLSPGAGFASYLWQDGSTAPVYTVTAAGTYWVEVPAPAGCRRSDTVTVTIRPLPAAFLQDTVMCASLPITLRPAGSFTAYQWSDGSAGAALEVTRGGRYTLRVRDAHGCSGEDEAVVEEKPCPQLLYFPTAFSPNGDGLNDTYRPTVLSPLLYYRFAIYNRWGQPVFSTSAPGQGWDGRLRSKRQSTGLFTWVCTYQFPGAPRTVAKGSFLLVN